MTDETPRDALPSGPAQSTEDRDGAAPGPAPPSAPPPAEAPSASPSNPAPPLASAVSASPLRGAPAAPPRPGGPRSTPPPRPAAGVAPVVVPLPAPPPPPTLPTIAGLDELAPLGPAPVFGPRPPAPSAPDGEADGRTRSSFADPPTPAPSDPGDGWPARRRQSRRTVKIPADSVPRAQVVDVSGNEAPFDEISPTAPPGPVASFARLPDPEVEQAPPPPPGDDVIRPQRIIQIGSVPPPASPDVLEKGWTPMPPVVEQAASLVSAGMGVPEVARAPLVAPTPEIDVEPFDDFGPLDEPTAVPDAAPTRRGEVRRPIEVPDAAPTLPRSAWSDVEIPDAAPTIPGSSSLPWAPGHGGFGPPSDPVAASPPGGHPPPPPVAGPPKVVIAAAALEAPLPPPPSSPFRIHDPETIDEIDVDATDSAPPSEEIPVDLDMDGPLAAPRKPPPPPPPPKRAPSASIPDIGAPPVPFPSLAILTQPRDPAPGALPAIATVAAAPSADDVARARPTSDRPPAAISKPPPPPAARPAATPPPTSAPGAVAPAFPGAAPVKPSPVATTTPPETRKRPRSWWEDLFGDDYLRTMDRLEPKHVRKDADFIEESLALEKGAVILDLACGAGQHAVELASRGYSVVGYDLSLAMLARAADEAQDRGQKLNFLQGDMREMAFEETFDGIYCWGTSFGYFDEEKNLDVLLRAHRALRQGGMLLLDVTNRDYVAPRLPSLVWFEGEGCVCMDETYFDFFTSRLRVKRTAMFDDGRSREIDYSIRLYALHELGTMLHDAGYKVVEVTGHHAHPGVFFGTESPRILIVAEKG